MLCVLSSVYLRLLSIVYVIPGEAEAAGRPDSSSHATTVISRLVSCPHFLQHAVYKHPTAAELRGKLAALSSDLTT